MTSIWFSVFLFSIWLSFAACWRYYPSRPDDYFNAPDLSDTGKPLFLTPYINSGQTAIGRRLSLVKGLPYSASNITSYSGFITVNSTYNSNLFFWYFLAEIDPDNAPVVMWLQGGPGGSSMFGLFSENGPFEISSDITLKPREYPWTAHFNMLYVDNPTGTGFSFTDNDAGYAKYETDVARDLYNFTDQFFKLFPNFARNEFFISGESYAGKYVPALAHAILYNPSSPFNLAGIAIGNGYTDPESMIMAYAPFLYRIGLLDKQQEAIFGDYLYQAVLLISQGQYTQANHVLDALFDGEYTQTGPLFRNFTGCGDYYDYLKCHDKDPMAEFALFFRKQDVRKAIHVGNLAFHTDFKVPMMMQDDIQRSVREWFVDILNSSIEVMVYNGALDIICGLPLAEAMLQSLEWAGSAEYFVAPKIQWKVNAADKEVAGYVRLARNLYQVAVKNAGHQVPADQPSSAFDMINRFVFHRGF